MARTPPALQEVTLPVCGQTVKIRPLGSFSMDAIRATVRKAMPKPQPPMVEVSLMGGAPRLQPNEADPDYIAAVQQWNMDVFVETGKRFTDVMESYAVVFEVDQEWVDTFRAGMAAAGIELDGDDRSVFLRHFLIDHDDDNTFLSQAVLRRSQPTPEVVAEKVEAFPGDVQGT